MKRRIDSDSLFWGVFMILVGTGFMLDRLHIFRLREWWPLFLVAWGISKLVSSRHVWSGISTILIGLWCQASVSHWGGMSFSSSWPLLLIALGATTITRVCFEGWRTCHGGDQSNQS